MKQVVIDNKKYSLKSSYNEMNEKEFLMIASIRSKYLAKITKVEFNSLRIQAFYCLCSAPLSLLKKLNNIQLIDCLQHVDFVFGDLSKIDQNPIPYFRLGMFGQKYYCSPGMLSKLTIEELADADSAFIAASNTQDIDKMYLLTAILYRPKQKNVSLLKQSSAYNGDIREVYNSQRIRDRIPLLKKKLPFYVCVGVFMFFQSFRENQLLNDPVIKTIFEGENASKGLNLSWLGTLLEVSDGKFGNYDETIVQNWKLVLYEIARQMDRAKQLEQQAEERRIRANLHK